MTTATKHTDRRIAVLAILGAIIALTAILGLVVGCAPQESAAPETKKSEQGAGGGASAMDGQPVNWTMESDCGTCHTTEHESMTDAAYPQASAHTEETCIDCHTKEDVLTTSHADVKFGDKVASKATVISVDPETCITCHGSMEEMAKLTADSTALTDSNGVTVNPHERPEGPKHEENPATCTDCHKVHTKDMGKDAMKYCAQCHHRGVFQCGTCHELRG